MATLLQRLGQKVEEVNQKIEVVNKKLEDGMTLTDERINKEWNSVPLQCPSCSSTLRDVAPSATVVSCGGCGASITPPGVGRQLGYHFQRIGAAVGNRVQRSMGKPEIATAPLPKCNLADEEIPVAPPAVLLAATVVTAEPTEATEQAPTIEAPAAEEEESSPMPPSPQPGDSSIRLLPELPEADASDDETKDASDDEKKEATLLERAREAPRVLVEKVAPHAETVKQVAITVGSNVQEGTMEAVKQVNTEWNNVLTECPSCSTALQVPTYAQVFTCGSCEAKLRAPDATNRLSHHVDRLACKIGNLLNDSIGKTVKVQVTAPEDAKAGEPAMVKVGPRGIGFSVVMPEDVAPGSEFTVQVPASIVAPVPCWRTVELPKQAPVAEVKPVDAALAKLASVSEATADEESSSNQPEETNKLEAKDAEPVAKPAAQPAAQPAAAPEAVPKAAAEAAAAAAEEAKPEALPQEPAEQEAKKAPEEAQAEGQQAPQQEEEEQQTAAAEEEPARDKQGRSRRFRRKGSQ